MKQFLIIPFVLGAFLTQAQTTSKPLPSQLGTIVASNTIPQIKSEEAKNHIGETVTICDVVMDGRFFETSASQPTLLNIGAAYPNQNLTVVINKDLRTGFSFKPEDAFKGKKICVSGKITEFKGKPQIEITKVSDVILAPENTK